MKNNQGEFWLYFYHKKKQGIFLLGQVIMKQHPRSITHKGLPENPSCDLELQRNICFFFLQGTSMQKDKGSPRPWKEAIARQAVSLCIGKSKLREKRQLLDMQSPCWDVATLHSNISVCCTVKVISPKFIAGPLPTLFRTCRVYCRNTSLSEPVSQNASVCDTEVSELNTHRHSSSRWGNFFTQKVLVGYFLLLYSSRPTVPWVPFCSWSRLWYKGSTETLHTLLAI